MTQKKLGKDELEIRKSSVKNIEDGAVTADYVLDREKVVGLLNEALATELVCALRYRYCYHMAQGFHHKPIADEFLEHAVQEEEHAGDLARRICQLNGIPNFNPEGLLDRSHADYVDVVGNEPPSLVQMIRGNLISERIAIQTYRAMLQYLGDKDTTTCMVVQKLLAQEEEHATDLQGFLGGTHESLLEETSRKVA